jgi:hypothetical protein
MTARIIIPDKFEMDWQGPWDEEQEYNEGDIVTQLGSSYRASRSNVGVDPDTHHGPGAEWEIVAQRGMSSGAYLYEQINEAYVWTIPHPMLYDPGGIEVTDQDGNSRNPAKSYGETESGRIVILSFLQPTKGIARLS